MVGGAKIGGSELTGLSVISQKSTISKSSSSGKQSAQFQIQQPTSQQQDRTSQVFAPQLSVNTSGRQRGSSLVGLDLSTSPVTKQQQGGALLTTPTQETPLKQKQGTDLFSSFAPVPIPPLAFEGGDTFGGFLPPIPPFPTFRSGTRRQKKKGRVRERIAPSLTGLAAFELGGITGDTLELSGPGGRSPGDLRFVPKSLIGTTRGQGLAFGGFGSSPRRRKTKGKKKKSKKKK